MLLRRIYLYPRTTKKTLLERENEEIPDEPVVPLHPKTVEQVKEKLEEIVNKKPVKEGLIVNIEEPIAVGPAYGPVEEHSDAVEMGDTLDPIPEPEVDKFTKEDPDGGQVPVSLSTFLPYSKGKSVDPGDSGKKAKMK